MATNNFVILVCFFSCFAIVQGLQTVNGRIKITVGTTSGCGDTVRFIPDVVNAYNLYGDYLDIEFIPWGRTQRHANGSLWCQFGVADCWANRLQRCALKLLEFDQDAQVNYMSCEFSPPYPSFLEGSFTCAEAIGLNKEDLNHCVNFENDELDLEAERKGSEMTAIINFIPSIVFNDEIDVSLHYESLSNLESMICLALAADPTTGVTECGIFQSKIEPVLSL